LGPVDFGERRAGGRHDGGELDRDALAAERQRHGEVQHREVVLVDHDALVADLLERELARGDLRHEQLVDHVDHDGGGGGIAREQHVPVRVLEPHVRDEVIAGDAQQWQLEQLVRRSRDRHDRGAEGRAGEFRLDQRTRGRRAHRRIGRRAHEGREPRRHVAHRGHRRLQPVEIRPRVHVDREPEDADLGRAEGSGLGSSRGRNQDGCGHGARERREEGARGHGYHASCTKAVSVTTDSPNWV
jgi:hypothetical protein